LPMIAIRLVSLAGEAPASKLEGLFGDAGGDIGRGADCTLVLPDPQRRISRRHLQVACRDGQHTLCLISSSLLVELDGVPMAPGVECRLEPGARIRIGPFELQAQAVGSQQDAAPPADDSMLLLRPQAAAPSVFGDLLRAAPVPVDLLVGEPTGAGLRVPVPAPAASGRSPLAEADALIAAFYGGLGLTLPAKPPCSAAAQAELVGGLLRGCVSGALGLLAARAIAKRELGADATALQMRENNPLKFAPDTDAALTLLLAAPQRGFVPPLEAVREAFDDLRAHEVALLAGMRAALTAVLDRFDPVVLEARLDDKGLWDNVLAGSRKAKLWERYAEQHGAIAREVEEKFDVIFASAFEQAYAAQRRSLAQAEPSGKAKRGDPMA
jgi:predicted component of type VI protein secretion system